MLRTLLVTASLAAFSASPAFAAGAIAVAEPADITRDGYASGISFNYNTRDEAIERALQECRTNEDTPEETRKLCKIVRTFTDQCVAVALDPQDGTPGAGWSVASTLTLARSGALQRCEATAGRNRKGRCVVTTEACDGNAN